MNEREWLSANDPIPLLMHLRDRGESRRFWLLAAAWCRHFPEVVEVDAGRNLVEAVEGHAVGTLPHAAVRAAVAAVGRFLDSDVPCSIAYFNSGLTRAFRGPSAWAVAWNADDYARGVIRISGRDERQENAIRTTLARCIFGNPFRAKPAIDPAWLRWNDGTVPRLAWAIYDQRSWSDMGVLRDALLDAGCDDADMLSHARVGEVHTRGCWLLDLLLNKG